MEKYKIEQEGASHHTKYRMLAEELDQLNESIVGKNEVIDEYRKDNKQVTINVLPHWQ